MAGRAGIIAGKAFVLIEAIDKTGTIFREVGSRFRDLNERIAFFRRHGMSGVGAVTAAIGSALAPLRKLTMAWKGLNAVVAPALRGMSVGLTRMSQRMTMMGIAAGGVAASLLFPFRSAIEEASEFDLANRQLQIALKGTTAQAIALREQIKQLAIISPSFNATDITKAAAIFAKAGIEVERLSVLLPELTATATATGDDLFQLAEGFATIIMQQDLTADEIANLADKLIAAEQDSTVSVAALVTAMSYAGQTSKALNTDITLLIATLAQLANTGLKGSKGGTSLNQFLESMMDVEKVESTLGITLRDTNGELLDTLSMFRAITEAMNALPPVERLSIGKALFDVRGQRANLMMQDALERIEATMKAMNKAAASGLAQRAGNLLTSGLWGGLNQIISLLDELRRAVGMALQDVFIAFSKWLQPTVQWLSEWITAHKEAVTAVFAMALGLTGLSAALIGLGVLGGVVAGIMALGAALAEVVAAIGTLGAPVLAAIAAGAVAIYAALAAVSAALYSIWNQLKGPLWKAARNIAWAFQDMRDDLVTAWRAIGKELVGMWSIIAPFVVDVLTTWLDILGDLVPPIVALGTMLTTHLIHKMAFTLRVFRLVLHVMYALRMPAKAVALMLQLWGTYASRMLDTLNEIVKVILRLDLWKLVGERFKLDVSADGDLDEAFPVTPPESVTTKPRWDEATQKTVKALQDLQRAIMDNTAMSTDLPDALFYGTVEAAEAAYKNTNAQKQVRLLENIRGLLQQIRDNGSAEGIDIVAVGGVH